MFECINCGEKINFGKNTKKKCKNCGHLNNIEEILNSPVIKEPKKIHKYIGGIWG